MPDQTDLKLEFDYLTDNFGWIKCHLTYAGKRHEILASDVFPPFPLLMGFVQAITFQRLPCKFFWDEEGKGAYFEAWPIAPDNSKIRLYIHHDSPEVWVDAELDRQHVVDVFLEPLREFAANPLLPTRGDWYFSIFEFKMFENLQKRGVALRSDVTATEQIHYTMARANRFELPTQWLNFKVFEMNEPMVCVIQDIDPFWQDWFAFLKKIVRGDLPAEMKYSNIDWVDEIHKDILSGEITSVGLDRPFGSIFRAEPVAHPGHFRFKVLDTDFTHLHFLLLDEVLSQRQFVSEFCDVFEDFLETQYQIFADENGRTFDLGTLPIDSIKALL